MQKTKLTVYGTSWCGDCYRVRRYLDRQKIAYEWVDIDCDHQGEALVLQMNHGMRSVPVVLFEDGARLVEPSTDQLACQLGLKTPMRPAG
jgi:mycoredoxin